MLFTYLKHEAALVERLKAFWVSMNVSLAFPMEAFNIPVIKPNPANFASPKGRFTEVCHISEAYCSSQCSAVYPI